MQTGVICATVQPGANREEMSRLGRRLAWDSLQELTGKSRRQLEQSGVSLEKLENGKPVWKGIKAGVSISHTGTAAVAASAEEGAAAPSDGCPPLSGTSYSQPIG